MRATTIHAPYDMRVEDVPDPSVQQPTDAVVRVLRKDAASAYLVRRAHDLAIASAAELVARDGLPNPTLSQRLDGEDGPVEELLASLSYPSCR